MLTKQSSGIPKDPPVYAPTVHILTNNVSSSQYNGTTLTLTRAFINHAIQLRQMPRLLLYPSSNSRERSRYRALGQALRHLRCLCPQAVHLQIHFWRYGKRTNTPSSEGLGRF